MTETTTGPARPRTGATAYRWAPLTDQDVPAWADLVNHLAVVDGTEEFYEEDDLREELTHTGFDPATDSIVVWDGDVMVAFTGVSVPPTPDNEGVARGFLDGGVREGYRGQGIGRALMDRMEPRVIELLAERHPGRPAYLRANGGLDGSSASVMLEHRGFRVVRYYNELARPLDVPVEVPSVDGAELVSPQQEHEEAARVAHNDAFRDHWGSGPQSPETWHDNWTSRSGRNEVSTLAVAPDGRVLAYVLGSEWVPRHLYVNILGTVREARGRGLARAALLRTVDLAARSGSYDVIELTVDSQNPSGATRLYESVGFTLQRQVRAMQRDLPL